SPASVLRRWNRGTSSGGGPRNAADQSVGGSAAQERVEQRARGGGQPRLRRIGSNAASNAARGFFPEIDFHCGAEPVGTVGRLRIQVRGGQAAEGAPRANAELQILEQLV